MEEIYKNHCRQSIPSLVPRHGISIYEAVLENCFYLIIPIYLLGQ